MKVGKETRRNTLAAMAGLKRFCPRPPKVILTTPMANTDPMTATHHGQEGGRLRKRRTPVTDEDQSPTVLGALNMNLVIRYSASKHETTLTASRSSADSP